MINEPTSAAIAYGWNKQYDKKKTIFIYDLGGGTFDVSVMTIHGIDYSVLASDGDTHLGGQDFDVRLMEHFMRVGISFPCRRPQVLRCTVAIKRISFSNSNSAVSQRGLGAAGANSDNSISKMLLNIFFSPSLSEFFALGRGIRGDTCFAYCSPSLSQQ